MLMVWDLTYNLLTFGIFDVFPDEAAAHLFDIAAALTAKASDLFVQPPPLRRSMSFRKFPRDTSVDGEYLWFLVWIASSYKSP
jgi:hypothetical protein